MGVINSEFPLLKAAGLYVVHTAGNGKSTPTTPLCNPTNVLTVFLRLGNCLFHALSDQLYGDQSKDKELREATIQYMRAHGDYYKHFIEAHPGGGTRRNPKRKNAGSFSTKSEAASAADLDAVFEGHLDRMAKGGTYGDNMEIVAFSYALNVNVTIYKRDFAFVVKDDEACRDKTVYIAYHVSFPPSYPRVPIADPSSRLTNTIHPFAMFVVHTLAFLIPTRCISRSRPPPKPRSSWRRHLTSLLG